MKKYTFKSRMNPACIAHVSRMHCVSITHRYRMKRACISMKQPCECITDMSRTSAHVSRMNNVCIPHETRTLLMHSVLLMRDSSAKIFEQFKTDFAYAPHVSRMPRISADTSACNAHKTLMNRVYHEWNAHASRITTFLCVNHAVFMRRGLCERAFRQVCEKVSMKRLGPMNRVVDLGLT